MQVLEHLKAFVIMEQLSFLSTAVVCGGGGVGLPSSGSLLVDTSCVGTVETDSTEQSTPTITQRHKQQWHKPTTWT